MKKINLFLLFVFVTLSINGVTINIPEDYSTIQGGIDAAEDGDEVIVAPGTYVENINFEGKAITLVNGIYPSGTHNTSWNAEGFGSGIYLLRFITDEHCEMKLSPR